MDNSPYTLKMTFITRGRFCMRLFVLQGPGQIIVIFALMESEQRLNLIFFVIHANYSSGNLGFTCNIKGFLFNKLVHDDVFSLLKLSAH